MQLYYELKNGTIHIDPITIFRQAGQWLTLDNKRLFILQKLNKLIEVRVVPITSFAPTKGHTTCFIHLESEEPHSCDTCLKMFANENDLHMHKRTYAHWTLEEVEEDYPFKSTIPLNFSCGTCGEAFPEKAFLVKHVQEHQREALERAVEQDEQSELCLDDQELVELDTIDSLLDPCHFENKGEAYDMTFGTTTKRCNALLFAWNGLCKF